MEEYASGPQHEPADEIPEEIQARLLGPMMQQHIESRVDMPLPALKGQTPRDAVKTKAGRASKQVVGDVGPRRYPAGALVAQAS